MNKRLLIIAILLIFFNQVEAKKIPGYFISNSNDTVRVTFNISVSSTRPYFDSMEWRIKYYDAKNKKHILLPNMAREISLNYKGKQFIMLSEKNTLGFVGSPTREHEYIFLHLLKSGKVMLFKYYRKAPGPGMNNEFGGESAYFYGADDYILKKGQQALFKVRDITFKKDMSEYFSDDPDIVQKIEDKTYKIRDIEEMVDEYNDRF